MRPKFEVLNRLMLRSEEIAADPSMSPVVKSVYEATLKPKADVFRSKYDAIAVTTSVQREKAADVEAALKGFEPLYKLARAAVLAAAPSKVLPETLASQTTDTDTLYAITTLVIAIQEYAGQTWADDLLKGEFGKESAKVIELLTVAIAASMALAEAVADRAAAAEPAYKAFMAFKRVVREAKGSRSKQYRRLHVRSIGEREEKEGDGKPAAEPAKGDASGEAKGDVKLDANGEAKGDASGEAKGDVKRDANGEAKSDVKLDANGVADSAPSGAEANTAADAGETAKEASAS